MPWISKKRRILSIFRDGGFLKLITLFHSHPFSMNLIFGESEYDPLRSPLKKWVAIRCLKCHCIFLVVVEITCFTFNQCSSVVRLVLDILNKIISDIVILTAKDVHSEMLWEWRNDSITRQMSKNYAEGLPNQFQKNCPIQSLQFLKPVRQTAKHIEFLFNQVITYIPMQYQNYIFLDFINFSEKESNYCLYSFLIGI